MTHVLNATRAPESQADIAYGRIRQLVVGHDSDRDSVWSERQLSEQLGLGRTPVREALKRMQNEGLLTAAGAKGGLVAVQIPTAEIVDLYRVRAALESLAAELAAQRSARGELAPAQLKELQARADAVKECNDRGDGVGASQANSRFHELICSLADNRFLDDALNRLWGRIGASALSNLLDDRDWVAEVHQHHDELVRFISAGRASDASAMALTHIHRAADVYTEHHMKIGKEKADDEAH